MVDLWAGCRRGGGLAGRLDLLPCAGGVGDQPAALTDALALVTQLFDDAAGEAK